VDNPLRQNPNHMVLQCTLFKCIVLDRHLETDDQTVRHIPKRVQNPSCCHLSHPWALFCLRVPSPNRKTWYVGERLYTTYKQIKETHGNKGEFRNFI
jgi:hypothetical protein